MVNYEPKKYRHMLIYRTAGDVLTARKPGKDWYYIIGVGHPAHDYPSVKAAKKAIDEYYANP